MTKEERAGKLEIIEVMEDRIVELQGLIAEKEDDGVRDDTYLQLLLELEELSKMLVLDSDRLGRQNGNVNPNAPLN